MANTDRLQSASAPSAGFAASCEVILDLTPTVSFLETSEVRLRVVDFGGDGVPVLLLHGLCGTADEWHQTATWLVKYARVVAFDQRGHGESTRVPLDLGRYALVRDAKAVMDAMCMQDSVLIGQSIGGRVALLLAGSLHDRIRGTILAESGAAANPSAREDIKRWLKTWPASFGSKREAEAFFVTSGLPPAGWIRNLVHRAGRLYPTFSPEVMLAMVDDIANISLWEEWAALRSEILLIAGEHGFIQRAEFTRMLALNGRACFAEIPGAGHDVHISNSGEWKRVTLGFIKRLT